MNQVTVLIDDIGLNASHFGVMEVEEAVKRMVDDSITKDEEWAEKAWQLCKEKIAK